MIQKRLFFRKKHILSEIVNKNIDNDYAIIKYDTNQEFVIDNKDGYVNISSYLDGMFGKDNYDIDKIINSDLMKQGQSSLSMSKKSDEKLVRNINHSCDTVYGKIIIGTYIHPELLPLFMLHMFPSTYTEKYLNVINKYYGKHDFIIHKTSTHWGTVIITLIMFVLIFSS